MTARMLCTMLAALAGCYDLPMPDCGFACGPHAACPSGYACNANDDRCHRIGTSVTCDPGIPEAIDAGDRTRPVVWSFTPAAGAEDVLLTAKVAVMFSERVVGASPMNILVEGGGQQVFYTVSFDIVGNTATVTPLMPLLPATSYTVTVTNDLIDLAGNPLLGPTTSQFTTSAPPRVSGRAPGINAVGVPVDAVVVVTSNERIFGVTSASFGVATSAGPLAGTLGFGGMDTQFTFTPFTQLAPNTIHTVTLSSAIVDVVGNWLVGAPVTWSFTTGLDTIGPTLLSHVPEADRVFVTPTTSVIARFDEPVIMGSDGFTIAAPGGVPVPATIVQTNGGRNLRINPDPDLLPNTTYTALVTTAVTDASGNPLLGAPVSWSFTTEPL